jgi:guanosine-3',5'-bis(diphosphate) 3'-pyrophosphohydrolase
MANPAPITIHEESRYLISDLMDLLESYLEPEQVREVYRAYLFGAEAHEGQHRMSGEPYIYHPIEVAAILAGMHMDAQSIIAGMLHDVIEDTDTLKEAVISEFGEEVGELVDGVSKLTQIKFESQAEAQAENFRKMMLAMVKDIRVILVKLADRLHNMRTLGVMRADKRRRIARETLEIYAPIAARLGMNQIRLELEDLGFAALYPLRYRVLSEAVKRARGNRKEILNKIETAVQQRLDEEQLQCRLVSREKHLYSLYKKIRDRVGSFTEVFDVYAFRIIVDSVDTCYRVLGMMHNLYKPVPGKFKDYIAIPKANGYQSLHTVLFGPYGVPIEVQIRTDDMDRVAESGIAAHWLYKSSDKGGRNNAQTRAREWLRELLEMQRHAGNSLEFLENVKIDLFPDEVYVFTPAGEILELPRGATAVDFAYSVHTDVGNTCIAAKIDRRLAPLRTPLLNGQTVEIITATGAHPNPAWLNFVTTAKARSNIRHYLKNLQNDEATELGQRMLDKALHNIGSSLGETDDEQIDRVMGDCGFKTREAMYADIGLGNRMAMLVARRLVPSDEEEKPAETGHSQPLAIRGTEGMVVHFARCCRPIPGDNIVGFISSGRGLVIHTETCNNLSELRSRPDKWIDVEWQPDIEGEYSAEIRVDVTNQKGVLATIAAEISETGSNIENVSIEERGGLDTALNFTVSVKNRQHLARVMRCIRKLPNVMRISRTKS